MKKLLVLIFAAVCAAPLAAEQMSFVTLLAQPVGSFSRVELVNASTPANIYHLNFCNTKATGGGTITISGSASNAVSMKKLQVSSSSSVLKSTSGNSYTVTNALNLSSGGYLLGKSLSLGTLNGDNVKIWADSDFNHSTTSGSVTVNLGENANGNPSTKVASFNTMNIVNKALLDTPASGNAKASASCVWDSVEGATSYVLQCKP